MIVDDDIDIANMNKLSFRFSKDGLDQKFIFFTMQPINILREGVHLIALPSPRNTQKFYP
jgi:hypothetical protein